jgi:hypothetical protein
VVTDNAGATAQETAQLTVTQPSSIILSVSGRTSAATHYMTLSWPGARGATVDVYRNGSFRARTPNDGHYTNSRAFTGAATISKVCESGRSICSNDARVAVK